MLLINFKKNGNWSEVHLIPNLWFFFLILKVSRKNQRTTQHWVSTLRDMFTFNTYLSNNNEF
jgi:hypothetical protein